MKIKNKTSGQVIDVPNEHGSMLLTQGWVEFKEPQQERKVIYDGENERENERANEGKNEVKETRYRKEEVLGKRGRPKKSNT